MSQAASINTASARRSAIMAVSPTASMEGDVADLATMARVAELMLHGMVGETEFTDGVVTRHTLSQETISRAVTMVSHVAEMIEAMQARHFGAVDAPTEH